MNVHELYARRLRRLKWGIFGLVALFLVAIEAYYYFVRRVPLVESLVDWLIGMVSAVVLIEIGFWAVGDLQSRLQREIAEHEEVEGMLWNSETRLRHMVERSADGMVVVDWDGIVRFVNPAAEALLGRQVDELVGQMFGFPVVAGEAMEVTIVRRGREAGVAEMRVVEIGLHDEALFLVSLHDITERVRLREELRAMSLTDELTALYNRRGFSILGQQQLKLAKRTKSGMLLLFADLDDMKRINDTLGHHEGDRALIETAQVLKETFRESDVIARIGGDEFAVLAVEASEGSAEILTRRLQASLEAHNAREHRPYKLSLSFGVSHYDPESPHSLEELMRLADERMYEHKRSRP